MVICRVTDTAANGSDVCRGQLLLQAFWGKFSLLFPGREKGPKKPNTAVLSWKRDVSGCGVRVREDKFVVQICRNPLTSDGSLRPHGCVPLLPLTSDKKRSCLGLSLIKEPPYFNTRHCATESLETGTTGEIPKPLLERKLSQKCR